MLGMTDLAVIFVDDAVHGVADWLHHVIVVEGSIGLFEKVHDRAFQEPLHGRLRPRLYGLRANPGLPCRESRLVLRLMGNRQSFNREFNEWHASKPSRMRSALAPKEYLNRLRAFIQWHEGNGIPHSPLTPLPATAIVPRPVGSAVFEGLPP